MRPLRTKQLMPGAAWMTLIVTLCLCWTARSDDDLPITAPPESLEADPFYKKYLDCGGLPILSSDRVADAALRRAAELIDHMLADRPDIRRALVGAKVRYVIIGATEQTTDIPEYSHMKPKAYINERARGFGGRITSCGEENILCLAVDRYDDESILIHEFAHVIHGYGLQRVDESFNTRLETLYKKAIAKGLWAKTYAGSNKGEYWAEAVQSYYDANRQNNWNHNHVNTREELEAYDPELAKLVAESFGHSRETDWRYHPMARQPQVIPPPDSLRLEPYFGKYVWVRGFPVLGSKRADAEAMMEANRLIRQMFAYRHDVLKAMIDAGVRLTVVADGEDPASVPGYFDPSPRRWLSRAEKGTPPRRTNLTLACRNRDLLGNSGGAPEECLLVRQFALMMYRMTGFREIDEQFESKPKQQYELRVTRMDVRFDRQLEVLYDRAMKKGRWRNTIAADSRADYWAEGVQSWFDANAQATPSDGRHNRVNTREELEAYDPELAQLIADVFRHTVRTDWRVN